MILCGQSAGAHLAFTTVLGLIQQAGFEGCTSKTSTTSTEGYIDIQRGGEEEGGEGFDLNDTCNYFIPPMVEAEEEEEEEEEEGGGGVSLRNENENEEGEEEEEEEETYRDNSASDIFYFNDIPSDSSISISMSLSASVSESVSGQASPSSLSYIAGDTYDPYDPYDTLNSEQDQDQDHIIIGNNVNNGNNGNNGKEGKENEDNKEPFHAFSPAVHPTEARHLLQTLGHIILVNAPVDLVALEGHIHGRGLDSSILRWICCGDLARFSPTKMVLRLLEQEKEIEKEIQIENEKEQEGGVCVRESIEGQGIEGKVIDEEEKEDKEDKKDKKLHLDLSLTGFEKNQPTIDPDIPDSDLDLDLDLDTSFLSDNSVTAASTGATIGAVTNAFTNANDNAHSSAPRKRPRWDLLPPVSIFSSGGDRSVPLSQGEGLFRALSDVYVSSHGKDRVSVNNNNNNSNIPVSVSVTHRVYDEADFAHTSLILEGPLQGDFTLCYDVHCLIEDMEEMDESVHIKDDAAADDDDNTDDADNENGDGADGTKVAKNKGGNTHKSNKSNKSDRGNTGTAIGIYHNHSKEGQKQSHIHSHSHSVSSKQGIYQGMMVRKGMNKDDPAVLALQQLETLVHPRLVKVAGKINPF